jgi:2-dehydro-3-deoxy-D-gluconate 5-dehydrogenase
MNRFTDKVAIITGAGRGIGQAIALAFAREGARVVNIDVGSPAETEAKAREVGASCTSIHADFAALTQNGAAALIAEVVAKTGKADILVNNAGIIKRHPAVEFPESDWNAVIQINLNAPFFMCQAVAKWWINAGREKTPPPARLKIVNIASMLSFQGGILVPAYTASKSGIAGVTRALACEWAKERINVNAVAPGYIATENTRPIREDIKRNQTILDRIPEGRWGNPADIAGPILFLCSADADYLNGTIMNVDGGWLSR